MIWSLQPRGDIRKKNAQIRPLTSSFNLEDASPRIHPVARAYSLSSNACKGISASRIPASRNFDLLLKNSAGNAGIA